MTADEMNAIAAGSRIEVARQAIDAWEPRRIPHGWRPTTPFMTEDGHGDPITVPSWIPEIVPSPPPAGGRGGTYRLDPLL